MDIVSLKYIYMLTTKQMRRRTIIHSLGGILVTIISMGIVVVNSSVVHAKTFASDQSLPSTDQTTTLDDYQDEVIENDSETPPVQILFINQWNDREW